MPRPEKRPVVFPLVQQRRVATSRFTRVCSRSGGGSCDVPDVAPLSPTPARALQKHSKFTVAAMASAVPSYCYTPVSEGHGDGGAAMRAANTAYATSYHVQTGADAVERPSLGSCFRPAAPSALRMIKSELSQRGERRAHAPQLSFRTQRQTSLLKQFFRSIP
ncbi:hypothetical protein P154DRAFT_527668 [Amniculicola lignicola CBS 123094]|uniref:Uncharacterized protein n=1 Tax=Amniculicola lignicola CBS 123094 TaxID=1392246 RepID=A0A6A5VY11_9PLEO|nr:hypothetical protein P154DRAFT_527668 [Amniculicola lignicola CBS 123094]